MPSKYPPALVPKRLKGLVLQGQALWPQGAPRPLQQTWAVCSHFFWLIPPLASKHFSHSLLCARRKRKATLQVDSLQRVLEDQGILLLPGAEPPQLFASATKGRCSQRGSEGWPAFCRGLSLAAAAFHCHPVPAPQAFPSSRKSLLFLTLLMEGPVPTLDL